MGRETILKSVKAHKPELIPLPEINLCHFEEEFNLVESFKKKVVQVGGTIKELISSNDIDGEIRKIYPKSKRIVSCAKNVALGNIPISKTTRPHDLETVDLAILEGALGVAENGAVWISENLSILRVLPFIANDLVILLRKEDICPHLHQAYELISERARTFGVFISGPSKTADIEQCLVIGAQGAMSLTIMLL